MDRVFSPQLADLIETIQSQEDLELEYKRAEGGLPRSIWETVSAFANTNGGWIILGVDDRSDPPDIVGLKNAQQLLMDFVSAQRNSNKINHPVCGANDARIERVGEKDLIVIRVPSVGRKDRPIYIGDNPFDGTFVRGHAGDFHCTRREVLRMMREAADEPADSLILEGFRLDDLDPESIRRYRQQYQNEHRDSAWNSYSDRELLTALRACRTDRETGREGITVAGLLMFGTPQALRDWRTPHYIDFRLIGSDPTQRWADRHLHDDNLYQAFQEIYPRLTRGLATPFRMVEGKRIDEGPEHAALREALVNLLVHTDYAETEASLIIRSSDGYSFRNPGASRVPVNDLRRGVGSDARNPDVMTMFRLIGLAEEAGSGLPQIFHAWRELGLRPPAIENDAERNEFRIELRLAHLIREDDREWLQWLGHAWTEAEQLALLYARDEGSIDNATLRELTGLNVAEATRVLGGLRARGFLEMIGAKRWAHYELGPQIAEREPAGQLPLTVGAGDEDLSSTTVELPPSTVELDDQTAEFDSTTAHLEAAFLRPEVNAARSALRRIADPVRARRRVSKDVRNDAIERLCSIVPLSAAELALLLGRSPSTIRLGVEALIAERRLELLYPAQLHHPQQRLRAPELIDTDTEGASTR